MVNNEASENSFANLENTTQTAVAVDIFSTLRAELSSRPHTSDQLSEIRKPTEVALADPPKFDLTLGPDKFEGLLGKDIAKAFKDNGVKEVKVTSNADGSYHLKATLDKAVQVPQDLAKDGCYHLTIDKDFQADVSRDAKGKITIDNIQGMQANIPAIIPFPPGRRVEAQVDRIELSKAADGTTQVDTTGSRAGGSRTDTKFKDADFYDKVKGGLDQLDTKKKAAAPAGTKKTASSDLPGMNIA